MMIFLFQVAIVAQATLGSSSTTPNPTDPDFKDILNSASIVQANAGK